MKIHELSLQTKTAKKRVGRGIGSGYGKTAGRGTKGQNARTGGGVRPGFEGGQNPLAKRLPKKRGFAARSRVSYQVVNVGDLDRLSSAIAGPEQLAAAGLVKHATRRIKLLGQGTISKKLSLRVNAASVSAKTAVEAAGGSVEVVQFKSAPSKKATRPAKAEPQPKEEPQQN
jgi:large subunit ribosomal protein L15